MRYKDTAIYQHENKLFFGIRQPVEYDSYILYTMIYGDRLDLVALKFYNDPELWWVIVEANSDNLWWPFTVVPGAQIKIPVLENIPLEE